MPYRRYAPASGRSRKSRSGAGASKTAWIGLGSLGIIALLLGGTMLVAPEAWSALDAPLLSIGSKRDKNGCLPSPSAVELVAIDGAARFTAAQVAALPELIDGVHADLGPEARMELHRLDASTAFAATPRIAFCAAAEALDGGGLTGPSKEFSQRVKARAARDLHAVAVKALTETAPRRAAAVAFPIAAGMAAMAQDAKRHLQPGAPIRITLISDLAEAPDGAWSGPALAGVGVDVIFVTGPSVSVEETGRRERAWRTALGAAGAHVSPGWTRIAAPAPAPRDAGGCLIAPRDVLLVLFDDTADYAPGQIQRLRTELRKEAATLAPDAVLEVHRLGETAGADAAPALRICAPESATGELASALRDGFLAQAAADLDAVTAKYGEGSATPLMETFSAAINQSVQGRGPIPRRRVLLFTDGLINAASSGGLAFFDNGQVAFKDVAERPAVRRTQVDLAGAEARVIYARRDAFGWGDLQNETHRRFLRDWLVAQSASLAKDAFIELPDS